MLSVYETENVIVKNRRVVDRIGSGARVHTANSGGGIILFTYYVGV